MTRLCSAPPADVSPAPRSPDEIERDWFGHVCHGDPMPQLTAHAVIMGMVLGMVMACSNVCVTVKPNQ